MKVSRNPIVRRMPLAVVACLVLAGSRAAGTDTRDFQIYTVKTTVKDNLGNPVHLAWVKLTVTYAGGGTDVASGTTDVSGKKTLQISHHPGYKDSEFHLHAEKDIRSGAMAWDCNCQAGVSVTVSKTVIIKSTTSSIIDDAGVAADPDVYTVDGPQPPNAVEAFVVEGGDPVGLDSYSMSMSFDPTYFSCSDAQPAAPFDDFFDFVIDNDAGTMYVAGSCIEGTYPWLGSIESPTRLFDVYWEVKPFVGPIITTVSIDECQMDVMGAATGDVSPAPCTTEYLLGEFPEIPAVSAWGMVAMTLLVFTAGTLVLLRRRAVRV